MGSSHLKSSSPNKGAAIEELIKGRKFTSQLGALLQEASLEDKRPDSATMALVEKILGSFSRALTALDSGVKLQNHQDDDNRDENSSKKRKIQLAQRGGYRRRAHPYSLTRITSKKLDDGRSWRKYGQKVILKTTFPRSYFRCTHKHDKGCLAMKQVQQSDEDPSLFVITYIGEHTCEGPSEAIASLQSEPCMLNFGSNTAAAGRQEPQFTSPNLKKECDDEVVSNLTPGSSSLDYFVLPELDTLEGSVQLAAEFVGGASDHGDVTSGLQYSASSLDWGFMEEPFEFNDVFSFDQIEFFRD